MTLHETHLLATLKAVSLFGDKYAADFAINAQAVKQFALVKAAITDEDSFGSTQISGEHEKSAGVHAKAVAYKLLHDDLLAISNSAHSLALLGTQAIDGKFRMPRNHGAQDMLNAGRAFKKDVAPYAADMIGLGLETDFVAHLDAHIAQYETAIKQKSSGKVAEGGATGGMHDASHQATIALHVVDTIVRNLFKNIPERLAEWAIASHVEKHAPVKRQTDATTTTSNS